jgi:hypothetical protein
MIPDVKRLTFCPEDAAVPLWDADNPERHVNLGSLALRDDTRNLDAGARRTVILRDGAAGQPP